MIEFFRWVEGFGQDLRYGARSLLRAPGLVVVSMLSLALGFGLNLTLYAAVNTIFRHQPTMNDPARVVGIEPGNGRQYSYPNYRDLREQGGFAAVTGFRIGGMNRRVGDDLERLGVLVVTDNFFEASVCTPAWAGRLRPTKPRPSADRDRSSWIIRTGAPAMAPIPRHRPDDGPRR